MTVNDYAKYTIDNLHRATLSNALNISSKIDKPNCYSFIDFANGLKSYAIELLKLNTSNDIYYSIIYIVNKYTLMYNSNYNYNKLYIIDSLIIDLWEILSK